MKQKLVLAVMIVVGLAALSLTALAQTGGYAQKENAAQQPGMMRPTEPGMGPFGPDIGAAWRFKTEEAELARQASDLVHQLGEAKTDNDKEKIKTKLSDVIEKQFDLRQKRHTSQIEALEAQVKKLKDLVQKRQENRKEIVGKRLDQLQREAQGLGW